MVLPSIFWQMLLPFYFGADVIALIEIDIILSKVADVIAILQVVDGKSTFMCPFSFFFFVVDVITTRETVSWADVIATGQL